MRKLESFLSLIAILIFITIIPKVVQAHTTPKTVPHDSPMMMDEVIELKVPVVEVEHEIPDVRMASFEDPFYRKPVIRNLTEEDCDLLMRIAQAEAGNQDIEGRALVMLTVLNRCEKTGASVRGVIYAPNQFYTAGMCRGDEKTQEALALVLDGWDESEGCLYFCSTGWNYYGNIHLFKHGDHWFSK